MGKRQIRVNYTAGISSWVPYLHQEVNVVCHSGVVYFGHLVELDAQYIRLQDKSGNAMKLETSTLKELIVDFVS